MPKTQRKRFTPDPAASKQKRDELLVRLGEQAETLAQTDQWVAWLRTAAKFHHYSLNNQLLIAMQRSDAIYVAGFKKWPEMGRHVRKGEKGIAILAPCTYKVELTLQSGETEERRALAGFRVAYVFDVSQTEGEPLPEHPDWPGTVDGPDGLYDAAAGAARAMGLDVVIVSDEEGPAGARGWYEHHARRISMRAAESAAMARTMLHELGHALDDERGGGRAAAELVAESAAYIVGQRFGLAMDDDSTFYVASWGGDVDKLRELAQRVLRVAERLESMVRQYAETSSVDLSDVYGLAVAS